MSHPIDPRHLAEGKRAADQMMEAAFGRSPETTHDRLLKCMSRTEKAEAEVKRLTAELARVTGERDDALTTIRALVGVTPKQTALTEEVKQP